MQHNSESASAVAIPLVEVSPKHVVISDCKHLSPSITSIVFHWDQRMNIRDWNVHTEFSDIQIHYAMTEVCLAP